MATATDPPAVPPRPLVTLLTDFGTVDGFVGAMKGVILSLCPHARLVDLTHDIPPQDVLAGAWALRQAVPFFPPGTVHVAVVDPGVGTARRPMLLQTGSGGDGQLLVGPDNGLFTPLFGPAACAWTLDRPELFRDEVSLTFHGRDLFAPVAGHLAAGAAPEGCGTPLPPEAWCRVGWPEPRREGRVLVGEVVHGDRFGNLITNLTIEPGQDPGRLEVTLGDRRVGPLRRTFGEVPPGQWVAYVGSSGLVEVGIRNGDARAATPGGGRGVEVRLCPAR